MGARSGRNYGTTGIIDLDPSPIGTMQIEVDVFGLAAALAASIVDVTGPGANFANKVYGSNVGGGGTVTGKVQANQRPFPITMRNLQGTLTHTLHDSCTIAFPVLIKVVSVKKDKRSADIWNVEAEWVKNGAETVNWAGTAPTYVQPSLTAGQLNAGSDRTSDPRDLAQSATVKYFLPTPAAGTNSGYTDFATIAAIDTFISTAVAPRDGLKAVSSSFVRLDDPAGILLVRWAFNDTVDNYQLPNTWTSIDDQGLQSAASIGVVNGTGNTPSGFVLRAETVRTITNGTGTHSSYLTVSQFGLRNTVEDLEFPGTYTDIDDNGLRTSGRKTTVHDTSTPPSDPTPPSGTKIVGKTTFKLTSAGTAKSYTVWEFGTRDSKDEYELSNTWEQVDPQGLDSAAMTATVDADPSLPAGYVSRGLRTSTITGVGGHVLKIISGGLSSTADDVLNAGNVSTRSALEAFTRVTLELVDTTDSTEDVAVDNWAAFQATAFAYRMTVRKIRPGKALITREFLDPGVGVVSDVYGLPQYQVARNNDGTVEVFVRQVLTRGSGLSWLRLGRSNRRRVAREFTLSRLFSGTTVPDHQDLVETCNNATFLGLPEGSVMYLSGKVRTNIALSGTYPFWMDYRFLWISGGHYSIDGWGPVIHTSASISAGWVDASTLTGSGIVASVPDESDFSPFLS
jgi:hypothetical protein